jgi:GNAT superfamily N-acetyltransferase
MSLRGLAASKFQALATHSTTGQNTILMLDQHCTSIAREYWASFFDCPVTNLFTSPCRVGLHGPESDGYWGASALFLDGAAMISIPPESDALLGDLLADPTRLASPAGFAAALAPVAAVTLGPAYVGYASSIPDVGGSARSLDLPDAAALHRLEIECGPIEWEHGGSPIEHPCSGAFIDDQLASLAGYEVWGGTIAHISIVTHPAFRSRGYARNAVAHLATRALAAGLLPQYRTLESNLPSLRVAERLGFSQFAASMAVRFSPDGVRPDSFFE